MPGLKTSSGFFYFMDTPETSTQIKNELLSFFSFYNFVASGSEIKSSPYFADFSLYIL